MEMSKNGDENMGEHVSIVESLYQVILRNLIMHNMSYMIKLLCYTRLSVAYILSVFMFSFV
jgi:hypothetical protein